MARPTLNADDDAPPTRDRIVETATALFLETGYAGTSMSMLAQAAGIRKASLYHHFDSKEAVVFACLQSGYSDHVDRMRAATLDVRLSHAERLEPMLDAVYGAIVESNAGRMATIVAETTTRFPDMSRRFNDEFMAEMQDLFRAYIEDGMKSGVFDQLDPMTLDHALFGVPVNLTLCRSMFAGSDLIESRYDIATVKAHHLVIMKKLLGLN
ncbi:MAG: TetR/AcrR family transcriptional regulator [Pseudomonadota bacterium]